MAIIKIDQDGGQKEQFKNIEKAELKALMNYFKDAKIKMRQINQDTNKEMDMDDLNSD